MVDAGFADRDGDRGARDRLRRLRQRDQRDAVAFPGRLRSPRRRPRDADPLRRPRSCRATSKRQGSNSGKPRAKPVRSGKPVIQVEASALPQPLSLAGRCRADARDFRLRSATSPCSISSASPSDAWPENRKTGKRAAASALAKRSKFDTGAATWRPAHCARSAASVRAKARPSPQESSVALRRLPNGAAGVRSVADQEEFARCCLAERSGTVPASSATKLVMHCGQFADDHHEIGAPARLARRDGHARPFGEERRLAGKRGAVDMIVCAPTRSASAIAARVPCTSVSKLKTGHRLDCKSVAACSAARSTSVSRLPIHATAILRYFLVPAQF